MMTDPISDMLARLRNAITAKHETTQVPASKLKESILNVLKQEGFIAGFERVENNELHVTLKYGRDRKNAIVGLNRVSKPGRRQYVGYENISKVNNGLGLAIVSTSKGVMSDRAAREQKIGGEVLCHVW